MRSQKLTGGASGVKGKERGEGARGSGQIMPSELLGGPSSPASALALVSGIPNRKSIQGLALPGRQSSGTLGPLTGQILP